VRQISVLSPFLFAIYVDDLCALCKPGSNLYIIVYADNILLLAPTVIALEKLLHACERKLTWLDMLINRKKSQSLRVGQRCDAVCANVVNYCGQSISWVTEIRYLLIFTLQVPDRLNVHLIWPNVRFTGLLMLYMERQDVGHAMSGTRRCNFGAYP